MTLRFGPTTNLAVADTAQIGADAATELYSGSVAGPTTDSLLVGAICRVPVPAIGFDHTAIVTVMGDMYKNNTNTEDIWIMQTAPGGLTGVVGSSTPFVTSTTSPGEHVAIQGEFSGTAAVAKDYVFWHNGSTLGTILTWANVYVQVEIIKR
jgi:hypothetical protein